MNASFGYKNAILTSALSAGSYAAGLDPSNLQDDRGAPSLAWQTGSGVLKGVDGAVLVLDGGAPNAIPVQAVGLFRTNLTSAATWRWTLSNNADFSAPTFDMAQGPMGLVAGYGQGVMVLNSPVAGRYVRLFLNDVGNPDGFLNIPLAYVGPLWTPTNNIAWDTTYGRDGQIDEATSRGGQEFPQPLWHKRRWAVSHQEFKKAEIWPGIMAIDLFARMTGGNVLFIPEPNGADMQTEAVFGRFATTSDIAFPQQGAIDTRSWRGTVTERL